MVSATQFLKDSKRLDFLDQTLDICNYGATLKDFMKTVRMKKTSDQRRLSFLKMTIDSHLFTPSFSLKQLGQHKLCLKTAAGIFEGVCWQQNFMEHVNETNWGACQSLQLKHKHRDISLEELKAFWGNSYWNEHSQTVSKLTAPRLVLGHLSLFSKIMSRDRLLAIRIILWN